jgi:hypothetical protein
VLRFALGLFDPEVNFATSDYYSFIQKLFDPSDLKTLRKDIVILSFNYDPYFEWLMRRAVRTRLQSISGAANIPLDLDAAITSGFSGGTSGVKALAGTDGFCVLKLHGLIAWPNEAGNTQKHIAPYCAFHDLFSTDIYERIKILSATAGRTEVPILFPWEIMTDNGDFIPKDQFPIRDQPQRIQDYQFRDGGRTPFDSSLHEIFTTIWTRAREEVQAADKISFVGLSMHDYLRPGFRYLFKGKTGKIRLAITDRDSLAKRPPYEPLSPTARVGALRDEICTQMQWGQQSLRENFEEFILKDV